MLRQDKSKSLADAISGFFRRNPRQEFWALKDVVFDVEEGEAIGLIGHNGAGKSTMLKILTGIMEPSRGEVYTHGRVSALIEVGAGFHQEMTGRENIYLNGTILGMTRAEIKRKLDAIISFAGLESFIDTPVKRYSSGMYARLGFSVAAHVEPQVLLVDEVLAVGDMAFQAKCLRHMRDLSAKGCAVVLVTHSMYSARQLCSRLVWINEGKVKMNGPADIVAQEYQKWSGTRSVAGPRSGGVRWGSGGAKIEAVETKTKRSADGIHYDIDIVAHIKSDTNIDNPVLWMMLFTLDGYRLAGTTSNRQPGFLQKLPRDCSIRCTLEHVPLMPGTYSVAAGVFDSSLVPLDRWGDCASVTIESYESIEGLLTQDFDGTALIDSKWVLESAN